VLAAAAPALAGAPAAHASPPSREGAVRHVVLLAIAPATPAAERREIEEAMGRVASPGGDVTAAEWGRDLTEGARTQGYTHALVLTFRDVPAIERYRASAAHRAFVELATPHLVKPPLVLDYRVD
jgi:hypothetical protein